MTPAWTVGAWPPVLWQPHCEAAPYFVHLGTHVSPRLSTDWPRMGQTVWGGRAADSAAGVSWDWIEITKDVIAISDPMMMITNLRVLGRDGGVMCAHEAAPYLNQLVNGLPWQAEVLKALADAACEPASIAARPVPPRSPGAERRARARQEVASVG